MTQTLKLVGIVLAALVLGVWLPAIILFKSYESSLAPVKPEPPRVDTATKAFHDALPKAWNDEADKIDSGQVGDWPAVKEALAKAGTDQKTAFAAALEAAQRANTDDKGAFLDRKAAAQVLRGVAKAWK